VIEAVPPVIVNWLELPAKEPDAPVMEAIFVVDSGLSLTDMLKLLMALVPKFTSALKVPVMSVPVKDVQ